MTRRELEDGALRAGPIGLRDAVDRWGVDPGRWPDQALARRGREALLADRAFRAYRDDAATLDQRLKAAAAALDERIAGGALDRVRADVLARSAPRPIRWHRRFAAAAAVVLVAGVLGGASGLALSPASDGDELRIASVMQLDPLLFGPQEPGF